MKKPDYAFGGVVDTSTIPQRGRCPLCELFIKPEHTTEQMADGGHCHKICFDIVCAGMAAEKFHD